MAYLPIESHGIIGDLNTVALVGINGAIDFLCWPDFDSPSIFASLLDDEKGGEFQLHPLLDGGREKQIYLPDTNVLLSRFLSDEGVGEISDFMPVEELGPAHALVRRAKTVRGSIRWTVRIAPRFDYARTPHRIEETGDGWLFICDDADAPTLRLRTNVTLNVDGADLVADFQLEQGESALFILDEPDEAREDRPADSRTYVSEAFKETVNYWRNWIGKSNYKGRWQDMVNRSALTLKLLTAAHYGSIIAAPTFSLPEAPGGARNWDYRYTWIRDASFTLYALMRLGYTGEAGQFMRWIEERIRKDRGEDHPLQVMYAADGRTELTEQTLDNLEGYQGARPVRIGNAAYSQLQLDIYGELMDSVYLYDKYGVPIHHDLWMDVTRLIDWVCDNWNQPDEGIWEVRGGAKHFLYSRLMCWVAIDRGVRLATKRSLPAPLEHWRSVRDEIYHDIFTNFWSAERQAFTQHRDTDALDAATLLMPLLRFISPDDPHWLSTLRAIKEELVEDSLVYRYRPELAPDGMQGHEGTFSMCTFWYVECLGRSGDLDQARFVFEKMLGYANHLGLYAEQVGRDGRHLGNFPQAFTHLALISAAFDLNRRLSDAGWSA